MKYVTANFLGFSMQGVLAIKTTSYRLTFHDKILYMQVYVYVGDINF